MSMVREAADEDSRGKPYTGVLIDCAKFTIISSYSLCEIYKQHLGR